MAKNKMITKKIKVNASADGKNKNYDPKIHRLMVILNKLDSGTPVSVSSLAKEFNVTPRSIQRDLRLLERADFRVEPAGKGCYTFAENFSLKKLMLSDEEASLMAFLYDISESLGDKFVKSFKSLQGKVMVEEVSNPYYVKVPDGLKLKDNYPFLVDLEMAINSCCKAQVSYKPLNSNEVKEYKVCPWKIALINGFWYLIAPFDGMDEPMKLRIDRIQKVEALVEEDFFPPDNLQEILDKGINIWFTGKRNTKVVLKVDKEVSSYFKQQTYFPDQKIKAEEPDGSLVLETKIDNFQEIVPVILNWIPYVKVVSPPKLKEEIKQAITTYLQEM